MLRHRAGERFNPARRQRAGHDARRLPSLGRTCGALRDECARRRGEVEAGGASRAPPRRTVSRGLCPGHGCADRRKAAPGSTGIDVVLFFSRSRALLTRIMPITDRSGIGTHGAQARQHRSAHRQPCQSRLGPWTAGPGGFAAAAGAARRRFPGHDDGSPIVNAITHCPPNRSR